MIRVHFIENVLNILVFIFVAQKQEVQDSYSDDVCEKLKSDPVQSGSLLDGDSLHFCVLGLLNPAYGGNKLLHNSAVYEYLPVNTCNVPHDFANLIAIRSRSVKVVV